MDSALLRTGPAGAVPGESAGIAGSAASRSSFSIWGPISTTSEARLAVTICRAALWRCRTLPGQPGHHGGGYPGRSVVSLRGEPVLLADRLELLPEEVEEEPAEVVAPLPQG